MTDPTNDCLAIARYVYCSYYFPKCIDNDNQGTPLCKYVCDMWLLRCPEEPQFYCDVMSTEKTCSLSKRLSSLWQALALSVLALAFLLH